MKKFFSKNKNKIFLTTIFVLLIVSFLFFPNVSHASVGTAVAKVLGWIIWPFIMVIGKLATMFLNILIGIAQYNDFINSSAVTYGWIVVRDLCNMFFVLILLIIAFASILRIESYNLKTWLPKLIIMAVLINFSKLICGVFIDFTQVIMLTFVNAFKDMVGGNLANMLGLTNILTASAEAEDVTGWTIIGAMILALIFVIIATVVILTMLVMLVMRIIMIWIYVVLSPLAYLLASFPQGQSYSQRWWSDFSKNLIIGPIIAFFIWLSFASLGGVGSSADIGKMRPTSNRFADDFQRDTTETDSGGGGEFADVAISEAGSMDNMIKFIVSIGMLLGGMMIAQEMGGQAGKIAGKGMARLTALGAGALVLGKRFTGVERAQNAYKARKSMKESKRQELAQRDADVLNKNIGQAKKWAGDKVLKPTVGATGQQVSKLFGGVYGKKLENKENLVKQKEMEKNQLSDFKLDGQIELISSLESEKDRKIGELQNKLAQPNISKKERGEIKNEIKGTEKEYNEKIKEQKNLVLGTYNQVMGKKEKNLPENIDKETFDIARVKLVKNKSDELSSAQEDLIKTKKRNERAEKWASTTVGVTSVLGGLAMGLIPGLAPVGAAVLTSGSAASFGRKRIKHFGEKDLDMASNYNTSQINKHKENMKDDSDDDLRNTMNDYSINKHKRTAASLILMDRGELSDEEAKIRRDEMTKYYEKDNKFFKFKYKDNKALKQLDDSLSANYQELSQVFSSLKTGKPEEVEKAKEKIVRGIVSGTIKWQNMDEDSLAMVMPRLVDTLNNRAFKGRYDDLTKDKQKMTQKVLSAGDKNSQQKLAYIKDTNLSVIKNEADKINFLGKIEMDDVNKMVSKEESIVALKDFLSSSQNSIIEEIRSASSQEKFVESLNKLLKDSQLNLSNYTQRSIVERFAKVLGKEVLFSKNKKA